MARVVVVSSSQIEPGILSEVVSADDELYVVVPAVEQSRLQWLTNDEDSARSDAREVGEEIGRAAPGEPSDVDVKPDAPDQVVLDAIAEHQPDRIVVALRDGEEEPGSRKAASTSFRKRSTVSPSSASASSQEERVARRTGSIRRAHVSLPPRVAEPAEYGETSSTTSRMRTSRHATPPSS